MLNDALLGKYEVAALISNDSDLLAPITIIRQQQGLKVGILSPISNPGQHPAAMLTRSSDFFKPIRTGVLALSQFPPQITDTPGTFSKPRSW